MDRPLFVLDHEVSSDSELPRIMNPSPSSNRVDDMDFESRSSIFNGPRHSIQTHEGGSTPWELRWDRSVFHPTDAARNIGASLPRLDQGARTHRAAFPTPSLYATSTNVMTQVRHQRGSPLASQAVYVPRCPTCGQVVQSASGLVGSFPEGDYHDPASSGAQYPIDLGQNSPFIGSHENLSQFTTAYNPASSISSNNDNLNGPRFHEFHGFLRTAASSPASFNSTVSAIPSPIYDSFSTTVPLTLGVKIPQRPYWRTADGSNPFQTDGPTYIPFTMEDGSIFLAKQALMKHYTGLKNRDDTGMLGECTSISIRIEWPGYESWSRQIKTQTCHNDPRPITLAKLGTEAAKSLKQFIQVNQDERIENAEEQWKVGAVDSPFIHVDRVALVGLERVSKGSWQPVFHLLV